MCYLDKFKKNFNLVLEILNHFTSILLQDKVEVISQKLNEIIQKFCLNLQLPAGQKK